MKERLIKCDQFGREVHFFYQGQEKYRTGCGATVTFILAIGYLLLVSLKLIEFFGETDPIEYFSETR